MKLKKADIINYRSVEKVTVDFAPSCRALIGINESGKTNILKALALLGEGSEADPDDVRVHRDDEDPITESKVRFIFTLEDQDKIEILQELNKEFLGPDSPEGFFATEKSMTLADLVGSTNEALYVFDVLNNRQYGCCWSRNLPKIVDGWYVPLEDQAEQWEIEVDDEPRILGEFSVIHKTSVHPDYLQACRELTTEDLVRWISSKVAEYVVKSRPHCVLWSYSDGQLLPASVGISAFSQAPEKYEPLRQMFSLTGYEDISEAFEQANITQNGLRNLLNKVSKSATDHLRSVWKDYRGVTISIEPNGSNIDIAIKDTYNYYNFSRRSDGFKRFISFLFLVSAKSKTGTLEGALYLHDEPDSGLHPSGAKHLLSELIKISKRNTVVFSTHSIFMIDRAKIDRHYIVEKKKETTVLTVANTSNVRDEEVLYNALEFSVFELLQKENLLFEGWKDKRLFEVACAGTTQRSTELRKAAGHLGLCHAQGVKDIPKVSSTLELADRKWLVVSDGDNAAVQSQSKYTWHDRWVRYDELLPTEKIVTSEDFVTPQKVLSVLRSVAKRHGIKIDQSFQLDELNKLKQISQTLAEKVSEQNQIRLLLVEIKDELIEVVKAADLRDCYFDAMHAAIESFKTLGVAPDP